MEKFRELVKYLFELENLYYIELNDAVRYLKEKLNVSELENLDTYSDFDFHNINFTYEEFSIEIFYDKDLILEKFSVDSDKIHATYDTKTKHYLTKFK